MTKSTVYLPDDLKRELKRVAIATGRSESALIREAVRALVAAHRRPRPKGGLFEGGDPTMSERVDGALAGFGER